MMKFTCTFVFVFAVFVLSAQKKPSYKDYFEEGIYLLAENNNDKALENFKKAYELDSTSANINYMLGISYLGSAIEKSKAEYHLAKSLNDISKTYQPDLPTEKTAPPTAIFYYAQALHINYKFDEALVQYDKFSAYVSDKDKEWQKTLQKERQAANTAKKMVANPVNIKIVNMGDSINSIYPEYSAVLSADESMMIFTTGRPNTTGGLMTENGRYMDDIVVSYKDDEGRWSKPVSIGGNVNTIGQDASINLTPDGQTLIVFKNVPDPKNPEEGNANIYYSTWDGKEWSRLKEFGSDVNSKYWEGHACLNAEGNVLFFSSERPSGFGGKDIYRCVKLPNGEWSKALNVGPAVNTEYDEDGGFIHPDGQTFFFASNGTKTMGGYDIMYVTLDENNKFSEATNVGYPINTTDDDIFYVTSPDGTRAYLSSEKEGGHGSKDIYQIIMPQFKEMYLALFKGRIVPARGETLPDNIEIVVTDKQTGEIIGTYRPKTVNGTFTTILPPGKEYHFSYQVGDEEFFAEDIYVSNDMAYQEIRREYGLEPVKLSGKVKVRKEPKQVVANNDTKEKENTATTEKPKDETTTQDAPKDVVSTESNTVTPTKDKDAVASNTNKNIKKGKGFAGNFSGLGEVPNTAHNHYEFYHRYNHNVIDETADSWINFINYVAKESKKRQVNIVINASASKVPTKAKIGNKGLAKLRGEKLQEKIKHALKQKDVNLTQVKFKINAFVGGPNYAGDARTARKKYEKHQYVKAKAD